MKAAIFIHSFIHSGTTTQSSFFNYLYTWTELPELPLKATDSSFLKPNLAHKPHLKEERHTWLIVNRCTWDETHTSRLVHLSDKPDTGTSTDMSETGQEQFIKSSPVCPDCCPLCRCVLKSCPVPAGNSPIFTSVLCNLDVTAWRVHVRLQFANYLK